MAKLVAARERPKVGGGESKVRQSFKDEVDINRVLQRYASTGLAPVPRGQPMFADVSAMVDLKSALDLVSDMQAKVRQLPVEARTLFNENPEDFERILNEGPIEANLRKLGFLPPEAAESVDREAVDGEATPPTGNPEGGEGG